jgi:Thioredoxin domain-containing protein
MQLKPLNAQSFEKVVYDDCEPCVVVFSRKTCHVCQEVVPMVEELSGKYVDKCGFYHVDVEEEKGLFQRFSLKGVPQILLFNGGEYQGKKAGKVEEEVLAEKIDEML